MGAIISEEQKEAMIQRANSRSYEDDLTVLNIIKVNNSLGYGVVKGVTDTYNVSYLVKNNTTYVYECGCPHNTHRGLPCKHMFKLGRQLNKVNSTKKIQLVSIAMEKDQKEKVINESTLSVVDMLGNLTKPSMGLGLLASNLKGIFNASKNGLIYTHKVNNTHLDEVAVDIDYDCSKEVVVNGTNFNINNDDNVDTVTLVIKGTKVIISGNNLVVNVG